MCVENRRAYKNNIGKLETNKLNWTELFPWKYKAFFIIQFFENNWKWNRWSIDITFIEGVTQESESSFSRSNSILVKTRHDVLAV